jgi:hypothetical protein
MDRSVFIETITAARPGKITLDRNEPSGKPMQRARLTEVRLTRSDRKIIS